MFHLLLPILLTQLISSSTKWWEQSTIGCSHKAKVVVLTKKRISLLFKFVLRTNHVNSEHGNKSLSSVMSNPVDPRSSRKRLLMAAVQSVLDVWADSPKHKCKKEIGPVSMSKCSSGFIGLPHSLRAGCFGHHWNPTDRPPYPGVKSCSPVGIGNIWLYVHARMQMLESWQRGWEQEEWGH